MYVPDTLIFLAPFYSVLVGVQWTGFSQSRRTCDPGWCWENEDLSVSLGDKNSVCGLARMDVIF